MTAYCFDNAVNLVSISETICRRQLTIAQLQKTFKER